MNSVFKVIVLLNNSTSLFKSNSKLSRGVTGSLFQLTTAKRRTTNKENVFIYMNMCMENSKTDSVMSSK